MALDGNASVSPAAYHNSNITPLPQEAVPYSRVRGGSRYAREVGGRVRRRTIVLGVVIALVAVVLVGATVAAATVAGFYSSVSTRLNENVTDETKAVLAEQQASAYASVDAWSDTTPFYMLLLGVDSDAERESSDEYGADSSYYRTDTIILARIDPGTKQITLVSIHRDTWYPIDGVYQKINNAYSLGGVAKTIEVVSEFAGVPISHYAQVDMDAFAAITDALGGVWVDVPYEINDYEYLNAHLDAGYQLLTGEQAEVFVRSRHAYDNLGDGDRYRAAHQRLFLSAMLSQVMNASTSDMISVIDQVADYVETDLTVDQIVSLALALRGIDVEENVYSTMNPTEATYTGGVWYEISDDDYWHQIMAQVDAGEKPDVDYDYISVTDDLNNPNYSGTAASDTADAQAALAALDSEVATMTVEAPSAAQVTVKNASGSDERFTSTYNAVQAQGWHVSDGGTANTTLSGTVVVYEDESWAADAQALADSLGAYAVEAGDTWLISSGDIMVVVGSN
jgi:LCP family protein required for cell wall assembly